MEERKVLKKRLLFIIFASITLPFILIFSSFAQSKEPTQPSSGTKEEASPSEAEIPESLQESPGKTNIEKQPLSLKISGSKTITIQKRTKSGSPLSYFITGYTRTESLRLDVVGTAMDKLKINANIVDTDEIEGVDKVSVKMAADHLEGYLGKFNASFSDTEFTLFNRYLDGVQLKGNWDRFGFTLIGSSPKGEKKYEKFYGDRTQGPYRLSFAPVVIDSEMVLVDKKEQKRGTDYEIDYIAGTITFKGKIIDNTSLIEVQYQYSPTGLYRKNLYGARLTGKPKNYIVVGGTYLTEYDSKENAKEIKNTTGISPIGHQIIGLDTNIGFGDLLQVSGEFAHSQKDTDTSIKGAEIQYGDAYKGKIESEFLGLKLGSEYRRTEPKFLNIGDASLKQDMKNWQGSLGYQYGQIFQLESDYGSLKGKEPITGTTTDQVKQRARFKLNLPDIPELNYRFNKQEETYASPSTNNINERDISHTVMLNKGYKYFSSELSYRQEDRNYSAHQQPDRFSQGVTANLATRNVRNFTASADIEIRKTWQKYPSVSPYISQIYGFNIYGNPSPRYLITSSLSLVNDPVQGNSSLISLNYKAEPHRVVKTDGSYTLENLRRMIAGVDKPASTHTGAFKLISYPARSIALLYKPQFKFTVIREKQIKIYESRTNDYELKTVPIKFISTNFIYETERLKNIDTTDIALRRLQNKQKVNTTRYKAKIAPSRIVSSSIEYSIRDLWLENLSANYIYWGRKNVTKTLIVATRTAVQKKTSVEAKYLLERIRQRVWGPQPSNSASSEIDTTIDLNMEKHEVSCKVTEEILKYFHIFQEGTYARKEDLSRQIPLITTYSPAVGILTNIPNKLRGEVKYRLDVSKGGEKTYKETVNLRLNYDLNRYIHFSTSLENITSRDPDYTTTDVLFNFELTF